MITLLFLLCFNPGEKLEYEAKWSFLTLGAMTLEIIDTVNYAGSNCYHFTLNDTIEVYTRTDDILPLYFEEKINEGKYKSHSRLTFNHDSLVVTYDDTLILELLENSRDLVSFWYYLRTIDLKVGDTIRVNIHESQKNHEIWGGMDIWYSRDEYRYPVLIKVKIKKGSILFKLKGVRH
jgi:hypothetical protein